MCFCFFKYSDRITCGKRLSKIFFILSETITESTDSLVDIQFCKRLSNTFISGLVKKENDVPKSSSRKQAKLTGTLPNRSIKSIQVKIYLLTFKLCFVHVLIVYTYLPTTYAIFTYIVSKLCRYFRPIHTDAFISKY